MVAASRVKKLPRAIGGRQIRKYRVFYLMFIPVAIWYIIFCYIPMVGVIIAFKDFSFRLGIFGSEWAGLKHITRMLHSRDFWRVLGNTLRLSALRIAIGFPVPVIFALMLNEIRFPKTKKALQTISYLPHFVSWVVISGILFSFFSSGGFVNQIIRSFGGQAVPFMSSDTLFPWFLALSALWKELGWNSIVYLATLSSIDPQLYEAAMIDGAGRWKQLLHVTLPSIRSVVSIMLIMTLTNVLSAGFDQVLVMINSAVQSGAETIDYYIFRIGVQRVNNYSYATAIGLAKSLISLVLVLTANWAAKKIDPEGGIW